MTAIIKDLGIKPYLTTFDMMRELVEKRRTTPLPDEIWLLEHPPTFTQGQAGKAEHILQTSPIPIVQSDRGGQVTYHGPGQLIAYVLLDLKQKQYGIRELVCRLEQSIINTLADYGIASKGRRDMPGVYVDNKKIASIGLRVSRGFTYHGLSFNIDMDLSPFELINPCGHAGLAVTQLSALTSDCSMQQVKTKLSNSLQIALS